MIASPVVALVGLAARRRSSGPARCPAALPVLAAVGGGAVHRLRAQPARARPRRDGARRRGPRVPARRRAQDVALLRDLRRAPRTTALPPDNVQEVPEPRVAHRTSPTNIGMGLLATLAAHDLGFIDTDELVGADRRDARRPIEGLERFEGHLLNWYDTRTLAPLLPALRLDRRQRQPRRRPDRARGWAAASRRPARPDACARWRRAPAPSPTA